MLVWCMGAFLSVMSCLWPSQIGQAWYFSVREASIMNDSGWVLEPASSKINTSSVALGPEDSIPNQKKAPLCVFMLSSSE